MDRMGASLRFRPQRINHIHSTNPSQHLKQYNPSCLSGGKGTPLWRLSIEDPFETFASAKPHDLGAYVHTRILIERV